MKFNRNTKILLTLASFIFYISIFPVFFHFYGDTAYSIGYIPIVIAGLYFGWRPAVMIAIVIWLIDLPLSIFVHTEIPFIGAFIAFISMLVIGYTVGRLRDVSDELRREVEARKKIEIELREVNTTKDKFFSIIAHDLKNPFNALLGASRELNDSIDELDKRDVKETSLIIARNAQNAYNLLENLLEWSRSQLGRIEFNPQQLGLKEIVSESIKTMEGQAGIKEIRLLNKIEGVSVYADSNLLKTILRNLLSNAIKYTNNSGTISVSARQIDSYIEVSVTDTGVGMPPEAIEKIFRIDTKYSTPGTENETGTGLGLILCKEFVEKQGGRIWVESEVGKGTTFTFSIPAKNI